MTIADNEDALHCPLCNYSLRGLVDPRCPECGFTFEWAELREAARNKHPYLFEHGVGHNFRTFLLTFWRDWRPWKFWRELSPAHTIRLRRLIVYWLISNLGFLLIAPAAIFAEAMQQANRNAITRSNLTAMQRHLLTRPNAYPGWTGTLIIQQIQQHPPATSFTFWYDNLTHLPFITFQFNALLIFILWIVSTSITLLIFQQSMRRTNVRNVHLFRVVAYCCDYPVLASIVVGLASISRNYSQLIVIGALFSLTTYRLYHAYVGYLRLSFPRLTVLASQTIVALIMIVYVLNFTREGYRWWLF